MEELQTKRFDEIKATQQERADANERAHEAILVQLEKVITIFHGNGEPGVKTRLDRLEQSEGRRSKHFLILYTAAIGTAISALVSRFF
jgi:ferric-dicitrate binding protein FerR (iron transport regulator)